MGLCRGCSVGDRIWGRKDSNWNLFSPEPPPLHLSRLRNYNDEGFKLILSRGEGAGGGHFHSLNEGPLLLDFPYVCGESLQTYPVLGKEGKVDPWGGTPVYQGYAGVHQKSPCSDKNLP